MAALHLSHGSRGMGEQTGAFLALIIRHGLHDGTTQIEGFRLPAGRGEFQPHQGERQISGQPISLKVHDGEERLRRRLTLVGSALEQFGGACAVRATPRPA
jgi:hypothetical protein